MSRSLRDVLLLIVLVLAAHSSALSGGFVWDDDSYVTENESLRSLDGLRRIWTQPDASPQFYPMVFSALWVQYQLWGTHPFGYHLVNLLLHAANACLVYLLCRRLGIPGAIWAAGVFGVHPVHVESVAWITEIKNLLSGLFFLISARLYLAFSLAPGTPPPLRSGELWLSLGCFVLALLSKTVTCTLPVVALAIVWWRRGSLRRRDLVAITPYLVLGLVFGLLTVQLEREHVGAEGFEWSFSFLERLLIAGRALWFYVWKLAWPSELVFSYPKWEIDASLWWQWSFPVAAVAVGVGLWAARRRIGPGPFVAALYFAVSLFPALGFFNVYPMRYSFVADHFQYLASLGPIVLASSGATRLVQAAPARWRPFGRAAGGTVVALLAVLTWQQGTIYRDRITLFTNVIERNPASWMAHLNRAHDYVERDRFDEALADYSRSLELNPRQLGSYINRGYLYLRQGKQTLALEDFRQAAQVNPWSEEPHINIGVIHVRQGRPARALEDFSRAIELNPENPVSRLNRALLYSAARRSREALEDFEVVERLDPENPILFLSRARLHLQWRRIEAARRDARRAAALGAELPADLRRLLE